MAFSGLASNELFTASLLQEDVSRLVRMLAPKETAILDFLGDSDIFATNIKHEWIDDYNLPNYIINAGAVNSATANTAFQINGLGNALTVGTLLENESAAPEVMQVVSIVGADSIVVSRNYDGGGVGSLAASQNIYVRGMAGVEGKDHDGTSVRRNGDRKANTVGLFRAECAVSDTEAAINQAVYGASDFNSQVMKTFKQVLWNLEQEVVRGKINTSNSLGSTTTTRTMQGLRTFISSINSTVAANSFAADPHLYIGNVWKSCYDAGASASDETWAILAGATFFRNISNLNDTKVQDSNEREVYKRVIRKYHGPLGQAEVLLARSLPDTELLLIPRERIKVVPLTGRSFQITPMAKTGDNEKVLITGEYTVQVHQPFAMARLRV
jgi:hypothetical protein